MGGSGRGVDGTPIARARTFDRLAGTQASVGSLVAQRSLPVAPGAARPASAAGRSFPRAAVDSRAAGGAASEERPRGRVAVDPWEGGR